MYVRTLFAPREKKSIPTTGRKTVKMLMMPADGEFIVDCRTPGPKMIWLGKWTPGPKM